MLIPSRVYGKVYDRLDRVHSRPSVWRGYDLPAIRITNAVNGRLRMIWYHVLRKGLLYRW